MLGVVATAVAQIDPADEGDVPVGVPVVLDHEQLLVVRAEPADPLVQQHLPAGLVDLVAQVLVLLGVVGQVLRVRAPDQAADLDAVLGQIAEHLTHARALGQQFLVGVPAPVGEVDPVPGGQLTEFLVEPAEVVRTVQHRSDLIAGHPAETVVPGNPVDVGRGVAPLLGREEPASRRIVCRLHRPPAYGCRDLVAPPTRLSSRFGRAPTARRNRPVAERSTRWPAPRRPGEKPADR